MMKQPSGQPRGATFWLAALCVVMLLAGCETPVRLMPTPVTFRSGEVDPFEKAGYQVQGTDLPVFYVTNRGAVIEQPEPLSPGSAQIYRQHAESVDCPETRMDAGLRTRDLPSTRKSP